MTISREHVRNSNLIEDVDDPTADAVGEAAWAWLSCKEEITPWVVQRLHRIVTAAQHDLADGDRGVWRTCDVCVGPYVAPYWREVPEQMDGWLNALARSLEMPDHPGSFTPQQMHVWFERIHPFVDGNGRVGRLLYWYHQAAIKEDPTLLRASERHAYYEWFRTPNHETVEAP